MVNRSAAPPNALKIWSDHARIWVEYPTDHGPMVLDYPKTTATLLNILALIQSRGNVGTYKRQPDNVPDARGHTIGDKAAAYKVLKDMGLL